MSDEKQEFYQMAVVFQLLEDRAKNRQVLIKSTRKRIVDILEGMPEQERIMRLLDPIFTILKESIELNRYTKELLYLRAELTKGLLATREYTQLQIAAEEWIAALVNNENESKNL